ncbi:MAG: hypothetical protein ACYDBH_18480, partial [Acidobacteriaceae bacterium]
MLPRRAIALILLAAIACGTFLAGCAIFHFPASTGLDALWLVALTLLPGTLLLLILRQYLGLELEAHEILSLGAAIGFGFPPLVLGILHAIHIQHASTIYYVIRSSITVIVLVLVVQRKVRLGFPNQLLAINHLLVFAIGALLLLAAYNLVGFHFGQDGSIVTHGLFGVDLPFLAGEIHGIQNFGSLRDLHQLAQPWHYHDWTYQLLGLLPYARTLPDLAFASPLVGYALLALALYAFAHRMTRSTHVSYASVALWFLVSGLGPGEFTSYALSPSFVFGSILFLNVLLALDLRLAARATRAAWCFRILLFYLLLELSQTKLSTFLVLAGALLLLGIILLRRKRNLAVELWAVTAISFCVVLVQNAGVNPLMPTRDFLVGAPLLGYANHLAALLHVRVEAISPISHGFHLRWQSILIV